MIANPLEQFEIVEFLTIWAPILSNWSFSLTNMAFYLLIVGLLVLLFASFGGLSTTLQGTRWWIIQESMISSVQSIVRDQIGSTSLIYFPFILSLFLLILFINLVGMVPYSFTPTSHFALTLGLSVGILIGVTILGFQNHKVKYLSILLPAGTPLPLVPLLVILELISYVAKGISLGVRLGANLLSGHMLLKIISTLIWNVMKNGGLFLLVSLLPLLLLTALMGLELAIAVLQATVFTILTCSYIRDAIDLH